VIDLPLEIEEQMSAVHLNNDYDIGVVAFEDVWFSYFETPEYLQRAGMFLYHHTPNPSYNNLHSCALLHKAV